MSARIITYQSRNSAPDKQWLALIEHSKEGTIWITFTGPTEEAVKANVRAFWQREREKVQEAKARAAAKSPLRRAEQQDTVHG